MKKTWRIAAVVVMLAGVAGLVLPGGARADQVVADDQIVQGGLCAGAACADGEAFGNDALRLKTAAIRVHFDDQSVDPFPANDWRLVINGLNSGEPNFFAIEDSSAGLTPFLVTAGAPDDSFFMAATGRVGFGTNNPGATIDAETPAIAGAEIVAKFGTSDDATGKLFVVNSSAADGIFIPKFLGRSAGQNAALINEALITNDVGPSPAIVYNAAKGAGGALAVRPLVVYRNNGVAKATITAAGDVNATSFNPVSSREMKEDIVDLDAASAAEAIKTLTPVKYVYKDDESREPRVGFIAEDVPDLVSNADRKSVPIMDVVALVTRVVKDQQATIDSQRVQLDEQRRVNEELLKRLGALEAKMQKE